LGSLAAASLHFTASPSNGPAHPVAAPIGVRGPAAASERSE